ncbi:unnamed protein product [Oikopleura dioica]|uniref:RING-type domain-containing protein n=1 Tax=Oikopleura dioica TaxID=34765 RepID=E4YMH1_OIKDI|nr:unnamed protein product [Oikopleura dioica]
MCSNQSPMELLELDKNCSICLSFPKEQLKMKCCGSFLCRPCFDYAIKRHEQCSFCSKSEFGLKNVSYNSIKMKICDECEEEVPEKEFEVHKKCTKTLELEYQRYKRKFEDTEMEKKKLKSELHVKVQRLGETVIKYRDENIMFQGRIKTLTEALDADLAKAKQEKQRVMQNAKKKILQLKKELDEEKAKVAPQIREQPIIANIVAAPTSSANVTKTEGVEKNLTETEKKNLRSG